MATKSQMLNVNMNINADASKAKQAIEDLQKDLNKLMSPSANKSFMGNEFVKDIEQARQGAQQLSTALNSAMNVNTGKLDLTRFSQSLKKADLDIDKIKNSLTSFGPEGEKAFLKVANSIMDAEVPLKRTNKLFNDLWTTMKNTAKWQLSSSVLHGFMSAIQTAYGYSKDLNESLNNIRIVTGYGADQMAEFAKQANQAAKSLSTTTTAYTNAALIYYQQGLPEEDITARTNATVKMANVTGESARDVSNYMTAVWNNFDDGSRSLEYYADVMTALGAATASSTDEIAAGLEKFAAVSETVGLSYEYATAALATVTAETRQSADVVGNAFKTLFSRIQGLNLGETMEDGTDLNKYSQALVKVGIDIKDTNGQIKEMDVILDELGKKWDTLGKDTQIALAQAVAGVRQYTQLIALMDSWDTFKINLEVASDAEGELDKQQAIYEESWEASSKRVRAAWEGIYDSILDDDFFISINNGFADFLSGIENVIDGLGGMKGVVLALSTVLLKAFGPQMAQSINNVVFSIQGALGIHKQNANNIMNQTYDAVIDMNKDRSTADSEAMIKVAERQKQLKNDLAACERQLTEEQKKQYQTLIDQDKVMGEILIKAAKQQQISDEKMGQAHISARSAIKKDIGGDLNKKYQRTRNIGGKEVNFGKEKTANEIYKETTKRLEAEAQSYVKATQAYESFKKSIRSGNADIDGAKKALGAMGFEIDSLPNDVQDLEMTFYDLFDGIKAGGNKAIEDLINDLKLTPEAAERVRASLQTLFDEMKNNIVVTQQNKTANEHYENSMVTLKQSIDNVKNATKSFGEGMVGIFQGISSIALAITSLSSIKNIIDDESLTTGEKYLQVITSLGTAIPALIMGVGQLAKGIEILTAIQWASVGASIKDIVTKGGQAIANSALVKTLDAVTIGQLNLNAAMMANPVGAFIIAIGALIAILAGLTYMIVKYADKQQAAFKAMESAREEAEKTAEAYNSMKDSYASLIDTIENYEGAKNAISDLSKGTEEWYENINKANEYAQELIDTYDELAGKYHFNAKTGVIEFDPGVLEDLQDNQQQVLSNTEQNALLTKNAYKSASNNYDIVSASRNENFGIWQNILNNAGAGAAIGMGIGIAATKMGAILGSLGGPAGTLAGGIAGSTLGIATTASGAIVGAGKGIVENINQDNIDKKQQSALNNLIDEFQRNAGNYSLAFEKLTSEEQEYIKSLGLTNAELQDLCNNIKANNDAIKVNNQQIINSKFANNENYKNYEDKDVLNTLLANQLNANKDKYLGNYETLTDADLKAYATEMGFQTSGFTTSKDGKTTTFLDNQGQEVVFSNETIQYFLANQEALNSLEGSIDSLMGSINTLNTKFGEGVAQGLKDWVVTGNMSGMSQNDRYDMSEAINTINSEDGLLTHEEILKFLRDSFGMTDKELMEAFDVESVTELTNKWIKAWEYGKEALETAGDNLTKTSKKVYDELVNNGELDNLGADERGVLANYMDQVLGEFGKTGLDRFSEIFAKTGEDADEFVNVLDDIDWQTTNVNDLKKALKEAGITTNFTNDELLEFIKYMQGVGEVTDLETARESYKSLWDVSNLSMGDAISQEQFSSLTDINPTLSQFFTLMADGTYALTESAYHFNGVVEDLSFQPLDNYINQLNDRMELANSLADSGFNYNNAINNANASYNMSVISGRQGFDMNSSFDYLEMMGGATSTQLADWRERANALGSEDYEAIKEALIACGDATQDWEATMTSLEEEAYQIQESINFTAYKDRVEDLGLDFGATERYAQDLAEAMRASGQEYDNLEEAARNLAIANQRLDRGLSNLASNFDDYKEKLKDTNRYSKEYSEALQDLKTDIADIFNTDANLLGDNFIEEQLVGNPEKLKEIANGNMETINNLRGAVADEIVSNIEVRVDDSEMYKFKSAYDALKEVFAYEDLSVGVQVMGEEAFIANLNQLISSANMTRDEVNALLGSMGMSAELQTTYKETDVEVPVYTTSTREAGETVLYDTIETAAGPVSYPKTYKNTETFTVQTGTETMKGMVPVTSIKTVAADGSSSGGGIDILTNSESSSAPTITPSSSNVGGYDKKKNSGGGGGKEAKKVENKNADEEVDRYKEIDDKLKSISRSLKQIQRAEDTLYGASKISAMEHEVEVLREQEAAYREKAAAAREYIDIDRQAIANLGYSVSYDAEGNVANYRELINSATNDLNAIINQYNAMSAEEQEGFQEVLDSAQERYDSLKEALSQYEESLDTYYENLEAAEEARIARLEKNYEILTHELEYKLYDIEARVKEIDYYVNKLADDFYSMGEALALMAGKTDEYFNTLNQYSVFVDKLNSQFAAGEITQADYVEGLKDSYDAILENLEALQELDKEMLAYYGETLDAADEELQKYTDHMEHLVGVTDHYRNILDLIGRNEDYATIGAIIEGQASMYRDQMEVSKSYYEMLLKQKDEIKASLDAAEEGSAEWEGYKKQWDDIVVAVDEAQDEMLNNTEEWLKAEKELLENHIAKQAKDLEKILTEDYGGSFDEMAKKIEALQSRSQEFLTETNKIYETNKLLRKAQVDLDKTTNEGAKLKIKNYMESTTALQQQNEVSNLELEIQQAKYDLLLAEIALEEAQNAKSKVRLQRDSEGNFGYVYTSDAEAVSAAEQDFEDAQNRLYNIGLQGAADYADKYAQTLQAMYDELGSLQQQFLEGGFASEEEYHAAVEAAKQRYYQQLEDYSRLYYIAMDADNALRDESWTTAFDSMISKTDEWQIEVDKYIENVNIAFEKWQIATEEANQIVGETLDETKEKVQELTNESQNLANEVVGEVIPAIQSELDTVRALTSAYFAERQEIMQQIAAYEALARSIREAIAAQAAMDSYQAAQQENLSNSVQGGGVTQTTPNQTDKDTSDEIKDTPTQTPSTTEAKRYRITARYKNGATLSGSGYPTESMARSAIDSRASSNGGVASSSIVAYMGSANEKPKSTFTPASANIAAHTAGGGNMDTILAYGTGGYTGSWGTSEGRLAMLHEKELILNKEDTRNILSAVGIVRDITNEIENSSRYFGSISNIHLPSIGDMLQELQQQVYIDANFPNVVDKHEIEDAFENLINMASQFANRKRL